MTRGDRIVIVDHSPQWAGSFESARSLVEPLLAEHLVRPVEHIGSTSVPGLPVKPIIDMLAVVESYEAVERSLVALTDVGWVAAPEPHDVEQWKWSWCSPSIAHRTHHLRTNVGDREPDRSMNSSRRRGMWPQWHQVRLRSAAMAPRH